MRSDGRGIHLVMVPILAVAILFTMMFFCMRIDTNMSVNTYAAGKGRL